MVPNPTIDEVDLKAVLEPVDRERSAVALGDIDEYFAALTDDAQFMPPNSVAKGGEELRGWLAEFVRDFRVEWLAFSTAEAFGVADLAYHAFAYIPGG